MRESIAINRVERFYELVKKPNKKERKCITCGRKFISDNAGHRYCCHCAVDVAGFGPRAEAVLLDHKG